MKTIYMFLFLAIPAVAIQTATSSPAKPKIIADALKLKTKDAQIRFLQAQIARIQAQQEFDAAQKALNESVQADEAECGGPVLQDLSCSQPAAPASAPIKK